jgi:hypothetical protein
VNLPVLLIHSFLPYFLTLDHCSTLIVGYRIMITHLAIQIKPNRYQLQSQIYETEFQSGLGFINKEVDHCKEGSILA